MRIIVVTILIFIALSSFAQDLSFKAIDSTMYYLYESGNWKALNNYGKKLNFDYYYFNVRMGIANFNLKKYYTAEKYLKKASINNKTDVVNEYLFWTYKNIGEDVLAEQVFNQLSVNAKKEVEYKKTIITDIYLEAGVKYPSIDTVGNLNYGFFSLQHRLGNKIRFTHTLSLYHQKRATSTINTTQYNFLGNYYFKTSSIGIGGILSNSKFSESYPDSLPTLSDKVPANVNGTVASISKGIFINFNTKINRLKLNFNTTYITQQIAYNYTTSAKPPPFQQGMQPPYYQYPPPISFSADSAKTRNSFINSLSVAYVPKFLKDKLTIGTELFTIYTDKQSHFIIKPFINLLINDKLWLNADYLEVKEFLFADYSNSILYNSLYLSTKRFSSTLNVLITPKLVSKLTYIFEQSNNSYEKLNYNTQSIFLGIQYKF